MKIFILGLVLAALLLTLGGADLLPWLGIGAAIGLLCALLGGSTRIH